MRLVSAGGSSPGDRVRQRPGIRELSSRRMGLGESRELEFIRLGRPVENCFMESFNGKLLDECPNQHYVISLDEAREQSTEPCFAGAPAAVVGE